jgi:hypothetical protein
MAYKKIEREVFEKLVTFVTTNNNTHVARGAGHQVLVHGPISAGQTQAQGEGKMERRLVLVHNAQPRRRVRRMAPANWNILWLREINMGLSFDLQIDSEHEDTLSLGCDVTFSALGVSGTFEGKEVDVYFKRVVGDRTNGDASVVMEEELAWMDIYVDDHAVDFLVMMYDRAQRLDDPLGLWLTGEHGSYLWHVRHDFLEYKRTDEP